MSDIKQYVPFELREVEPLKSIFESSNIEATLVFNRLTEILNNYFASTATSWGLDKWEEMLALSKTDDTDEERRSRIISKLRGIGTITKAMMEAVAESYQNGDIEIIEDTANYQFAVKFVNTFGVPSNLSDLQAAISEIKPAHLAVTYEFLYTLYGDLTDKTHGFLSSYTHDQIRNGEF